MQIFPVLDLMDGQVVRGVAGRRETYRPVESVLTSSCEPLQVAEAFERQLGLSRFYVADLDAIRFRQPQLAIIERLAESFPGLWLDCGIRCPADVPSRLRSRNVVFIAGLETIAGPGTLHELCGELGPDRVVFSLDLKAGKALGTLDHWRSHTPEGIAQEAIESGVRNVIVLDLEQVGVGAGVSTLPLCRHIQREFPDVKITTGGGIRNVDDLVSLQDSPIDGVLVASAFHNGTITREDLKRVLGSDKEPH